MDSTQNKGAGTAVYSDDGLPPDSAAPATTRRRWPWVVAIAATAAAVATAGVLVTGNLASSPAPAASAGVVVPTASAAGTTMPSPAVATSASVPPSTSAAPAPKGTAAGRYVSASAGASFDLPDGWTAEESTVRPADYPGTRIIVFNEAKTQVAELYHGATAGVGGACGPGPYSMTELDTAPALDNPWATAAGVRFSYRVLDMRADGGAFDYQIGLVDNASGQLKDTCLMYSFVAGAPKGTLSFADRAAQNAAQGDPVFNSIAEAKDYMLTPEYGKLKAMILSLEMQD